jgi:CRP-like cAMP-binding protein
VSSSSSSSSLIIRLFLSLSEVLSTCSVFTSWESHLLDSLADHAVVQTFSAGTLLLSNGNPVTKLYIIKRGVVKILKNVARPPVNNIQIDEFATPDSLNGMEAPGLWVLTKNWKDRLRIPDDNQASDDNITITVGVLGSGQVFGELAILSPDVPSPTSIISFTNLEVYTFDSDFLISLDARFNTTSMNILNESLNLYNPPIDKIAHYYRSKYNWENRKKKILKDMIRERPSIAGKFT